MSEDTEVSARNSRERYRRTCKVPAVQKAYFLFPVEDRQASVTCRSRTLRMCADGPGCALLRGSAGQVAQAFQTPVANSQSLQALDRARQIGKVVAGFATCDPNDARFRCQRQGTGILWMCLFYDVAQGLHCRSSTIAEADAPTFFTIDAGDLFAFTQIADHVVCLACSDAKSDALAAAAAVKTEHEPRALRCAAVMDRVDAECAVQADQSGANRFQVVKARSPDQRPVAEHPQVRA